VKTAFGGGTRGHNGLKSVFAILGSKEFTQMRVGVGRPHRGTVADYVLQRFTGDELAELPHILEKAVEMAEEWVQAT
jgi:PTH1 family peptidyl-tRNA hydrolase